MQRAPSETTHLVGEDRPLQLACADDALSFGKERNDCEHTLKDRDVGWNACLEENNSRTPDSQDEQQIRYGARGSKE